MERAAALRLTRPRAGRRGDQGRYRLAVLNSHPIQYFAPLYRRLGREPEIDLTVFYCSEAGAEPYLDAEFGEMVSWGPTVLEGYRSRFLPNLRGPGSPRGFWSLLNPGLFRELVGGRFDVLWVHGYNYATHLSAMVAGRAAGCRVFFRGETRPGLTRSSIRGWIRPVLLRWLYGRCDALLTIGSANERFYRGLEIPTDRMFPVPYCVDNAFFRHHAAEGARHAAGIREAHGLPPDIALVTFVGKLTPRKRAGDLLRAARRLEQSGHPCAVVLVGAGTEARHLEDYAARHGLRVRFLGLVDQTEVARILGSSDIFVLPSRNETWGLVVNEAMNAGLPVIVSDEVGAGEDLVAHGVNGFRYRAGDVEALAAALRRLLVDPQLRSRMGAESLRIIGRWDIETAIAGVRRALESSLGSGARRATSRESAGRGQPGAGVP